MQDLPVDSCKKQTRQSSIEFSMHGQEFLSCNNGGLKKNCILKSSLVLL